MPRLISPEFDRITLSKRVPPNLESYRAPGSLPKFGSCPKCDYLIQRSRCQKYQAWFVDMLSKDAHQVNLSEKRVPSFFIMVQIANTLDWKLYNLGASQNQEWSFNLYHTPKPYAEIITQASSEYTTFILFIPDNEIQRLAKEFPDIGTFIDQARKSYSKRLFTFNQTATFEIIDWIKSFRKGNKSIDAYKDFASACCKSFSDKVLNTQRFINEADLQRCYILRKFLLNELHINLTSKELRDKFNLTPGYVDTFTYIYGVSPFEMHRYEKMSAARFDLQANPKMSIKELADKYGYTYNGFIKAYKAVYHEHPTAHLRIKV